MRDSPVYYPCRVVKTFGVVSPFSLRVSRSGMCISMWSLRNTVDVAFFDNSNFKVHQHFIFDQLNITTAEYISQKKKNSVVMNK